MEDLPSLPHKDTMEVITEKLDRYWEQQSCLKIPFFLALCPDRDSVLIENSKKIKTSNSPPSLLRALVGAFGTPVILASLFLSV